MFIFIPCIKYFKNLANSTLHMCFFFPRTIPPVVAGGEGGGANKMGSFNCHLDILASITTLFTHAKSQMCSEVLN